MYPNRNQGAFYLGGELTLFRVWAPKAERVEVKLTSDGDRLVPLQAGEHGYHEGIVKGVKPGTRYLYVLDGGDARPDPASRLQPDGVHAPSAVADPRFAWRHSAWPGLALKDYVFYELHVGTFTDEGTFEAIIPHLPYLRELGVTCLELLPIAQFPGERNWGYDGVYPYAAQESYGGPEGLKRLVDAAHGEGLAVCLDVVYNHLGPEGNYLPVFGPYFTDAYKTPWGWSLNYDGPGSDEVRNYFIGNALYWVEECRIDALRLDAVHAIVDTSARPFLRELGDAVHEAADRLGRRIHLIAENDRNDPAFVRPPEAHGLGLDSQWCDEFHHALHGVLTGEKQGYYSDFGRMEHLARAMTDGFVYAGHFSPHRNRRHGAPPEGLDGRRFVVFTQNHDQVGNRMLGDRLSALVDFPRARLAAAAMLLSPYLPLLFMGEEYAETAPFQYFVSHGDKDLVEAVRKGRKEEFAAFHALGEAPDPQAVETFERSRLNHGLREGGQHKVMLEFYRELLRLRRDVPALADLDRTGTKAAAGERDLSLVVLRGRTGEEAGALALFNFGEEETSVRVPLPAGRWTVALDSEDPRWGGKRTSGADEVMSAGDETFSLPPLSVRLLVRQ